MRSVRTCRICDTPTSHTHNAAYGLVLEALRPDTTHWLNMTKDAVPADLTAFEGPDDWVSLYLDGLGEDVLTDVEVCILNGSLWRVSTCTGQ